MLADKYGLTIVAYEGGQHLTGNDSLPQPLKIAANHPADFVAEPLVLYRQSAAGCLTRDMKAADRLAVIPPIVRPTSPPHPISKSYGPPRCK